jgi:hypothetical protein
MEGLNAIIHFAMRGMGLAFATRVMIGGSDGR